MELFTLLFGDLLALVYHCFDRIVIHGYLNGLSRPEQVIHFFRQVLRLRSLSRRFLQEWTNSCIYSRIGTCISLRRSRSYRRLADTD